MALDFSFLRSEGTTAQEPAAENPSSSLDFSFLRSDPQTDDGQYRIRDADTVVVRGADGADEYVRIGPNIDASESGRQSSQVAKDALLRELNTGKYKLQRLGKIEDGRTLGRFVSDDGTDLQNKMVAEGYYAGNGPEYADASREFNARFLSGTLDRELQDSLDNAEPYIPPAKQFEWGERGDFRRGLEQGVNQLQAGAGGLTQIVGQAAGSEAVENWGREVARKNLQQAEETAPRVRGWREAISSPGNFIDFAQGALGQAAPSVAMSIVGGGAGGFAGRVVLKKVAQNAAKEALLAASKRGAMAGVAASSIAQEAGSIQNDLDAAGIRSPGTAIAFGTLAGLLDAGPQARLIEKFFPADVDKKLAKGFILSIAAEAGVQSVLEGGTEGLQTLIERAAVAFHDPNVSLASPEAMDDYITSALAGAIVGSVPGAVTGALAPRAPGTPPTDPTQTVTTTDARGNKIETTGGIEVTTAAEDITLESGPEELPTAGIEVEELSGLEADMAMREAGESVTLETPQDPDTVDLDAEPPSEPPGRAPYDPLGRDTVELTDGSPLPTDGIEVQEGPQPEPEGEALPTDGIVVEEGAPAEDIELMDPETETAVAEARQGSMSAAMQRIRKLGLGAKLKAHTGAKNLRDAVVRARDKGVSGWVNRSVDPRGTNDEDNRGPPPPPGGAAGRGAGTPGGTRPAAKGPSTPDAPLSEDEIADQQQFMLNRYGKPADPNDRSYNYDPITRTSSPPTLWQTRPGVVFGKSLGAVRRIMMMPEGQAKDDAIVEAFSSSTSRSDVRNGAHDAYRQLEKWVRMADEEGRPPSEAPEDFARRQRIRSRANLTTDDSHDFGPYTGPGSTPEAPEPRPKNALGYQPTWTDRELPPENSVSPEGKAALDRTLASVPNRSGAKETSRLNQPRPRRELPPGGSTGIPYSRATPTAAVLATEADEAGVEDGEFLFDQLRQALEDANVDQQFEDAGEIEFSTRDANTIIGMQSRESPRVERVGVNDKPIRANKDGSPSVVARSLHRTLSDQNPEALRVEIVPVKGGHIIEVEHNPDEREVYNKDKDKYQNESTYFQYLLKKSDEAIAEQEEKNAEQRAAGKPIGRDYNARIVTLYRNGRTKRVHLQSIAEYGKALLDFNEQGTDLASVSNVLGTLYKLGWSLAPRYAQSRGAKRALKAKAAEYLYNQAQQYPSAGYSARRDAVIKGDAAAIDATLREMAENAFNTAVISISGKPGTDEFRVTRVRDAKWKPPRFMVDTRTGAVKRENLDNEWLGSDDLVGGDGFNPTGRRPGQPRRTKWGALDWEGGTERDEREQKKLEDKARRYGKQAWELDPTKPVADNPSHGDDPEFATATRIRYRERATGQAQTFVRRTNKPRVATENEVRAIDASIAESAGQADPKPPTEDQVSRRNRAEVNSGLKQSRLENEKRAQAFGENLEVRAKSARPALVDLGDADMNKSVAGVLRFVRTTLGLRDSFYIFTDATVNSPDAARFLGQKHRESIANRPAAGRVWHESGKDGVTHVIYLRNPSDVTVLMHELGHTVARTYYDGLSDAMKTRLRKAADAYYGREASPREYYEWLANQFVAWMQKPENTTAKNAVEAFFKRVADAVRKLWEHFRANFKLDATYNEFADAIAAMQLDGLDRTTRKPDIDVEAGYGISYYPDSEMIRALRAAKLSGFAPAKSELADAASATPRDPSEEARVAEARARRQKLLEEAGATDPYQTRTAAKKVPMYYRMPANAVRADLRSRYPNGTSTLQMIKDGVRTATTRSQPLGKVGERIKFDESGDVFVITGVKELGPIDWRAWSELEGWDPEYIQRNLASQVRPGAWQTTFAREEQQASEAPESKLFRDSAVKILFNSKSRGYAWLSNFFASPVQIDYYQDDQGVTYPTAEHAYQALKTLNAIERDRIRRAPTAAAAKALGKNVTVRKDWNEVKRQIMKDILRAKFEQNPEILKKLLDTGFTELVHDAPWGDTYWGKKNGVGANEQGKILMELRQEFRDERQVGREEAHDFTSPFVRGGELMDKAIEIAEQYTPKRGSKVGGALNALRSVGQGTTWLADRMLRTVDGRMRTLAARTAKRSGKAIQDTAVYKILSAFNNSRPGEAVQGDATSIDTFYRARMSAMSQFSERVYKDVVEGLSDEQLAKIYKSMREKTPTGDAELDKRVTALRGILDDIYAYMRRRGLPVGKIKDYWPVIFSQKKLHEPGAKDRFVAHLVEKEDFTEEAAGKFFDDLHDGMSEVYMQENMPENMAERPADLTHIRRREFYRKLKDPKAFDEWLEDDVKLLMGQYIKKAVNAAEYNARFGEEVKSDAATGRFDERWNPNRKWDALIAQARKEGLQADEYRELMQMREAYLGRLGMDMPYNMRVLFGHIMLYQNTRLLMFSTLSSLQDPIGTAIRAGNVKYAFRQLSEALRGTYKGDSGAYQIAKTLGIITDSFNDHVLSEGLDNHYTSPTVQKFNEKFFELTLLKKWTNFTRAAAVKIGVDAMVDYANRAKSGGVEAKHATDWLAEFGLTPDEVLKWSSKIGKDLDGALIYGANDLTWEAAEAGRLRPGVTRDELALSEKVAAALRKFADESILRPDASKRPVYMSNPKFMLIGHLKSFMYAFAKTILPRIVHNLNGTNVTSVQMSGLAAALLLFPMAALGLELRELIQYGPSGESPYDRMDNMQYALELLQRTGGLGIAQLAYDYAEAEERGRLGLLAALGGPTLDQMQRWWIQPYEKSVAQALPFAAQVPWAREAVENALPTGE